MSPFMAGLIALVVITVVTGWVFTQINPFANPFEFRAVFASANNLKAKSPVRIAGVNVGEVTEVKAKGDGSGAAEVKMQVTKAGLPLHEDAELKIRPRIFLEGNFFVDVQPGSPSAPELKDGGVIPVNQTAAPVQFNQLLTALQSDTREDLQTFLQEYTLKALKGEGARGFNRSIEYWEAAYRNTALANQALLGTEPGDLARVIEGQADVAAALARHPERLKSFVSDFNTTAAAFAREDDDLQATIPALRDVLRVGEPALASLNRSLPSLSAFARDATPGVRSSLPTINASLPFVRQLRRLVSRAELRGLVADLRPTIPALARLTRESIPLSRQGRLMASCQNETILPWQKDKVEDKQFPAQGPVYSEMPKGFVGLAGESRAGDANGQWFRVLAAGGTNLVQLAPGVFGTTMNPILGSDPPKAKQRPPINSEVACETQENPDLRSQPGGAPEQRQVDTSSKLFKDRYDLAKGRAVDWLRDQLKAEKLTDELKVTEEDATEQLIDQIAGGRLP